MYLKQKGLKISGSKAELIDRVLTHARGNLSARDAVEDEESPNSCEDDTSSESSDSDDSSNDSSTCVEDSFEVMFVPVKGGGGLPLILSLCEGVEINFYLMRGEGMT